MQTKLIDGRGALYFMGKQQATKLTRQDMRKMSPSGLVKMDSMMGRKFTVPFLAGSALVALSFVYVIDYVAVQVSSWLI